MKLHLFANTQELLAAYASFFIEQASTCIAANGRFNVVLSGGSSPKQVYELLASEPFRGRVDWGKVYFFFGDERYVPADDPRNNALMAGETLFQPLQIAANHIFRIDTALSPEDAASAYMDTIRQHFKGHRMRFDLVLLGLGDNAHTASLFPFTKVLQDKKMDVRSVSLAEEKAVRITLTAPLINNARQVAFLVFGENKAQAVAQILEGPRDARQYPAQLIRPKDGALHWFLDAAAAMYLKKQYENAN